MVSDSLLLSNSNGEDSIPDSTAQGLNPRDILLDDRHWCVDEDEASSSRLHGISTPGNGSMWTNILLCEPGVSKGPASSFVQTSQAKGSTVLEAIALDALGLPTVLSRDIGPSCVLSAHSDGSMSQDSIQVVDVSVNLCEHSAQTLTIGRPSKSQASAKGDGDMFSPQSLSSKAVVDLHSVEQATACEPTSTVTDLDRREADLVFSSNLQDLHRFLRTSDTEQTGSIIADNLAGICIAASQSILQKPLNDAMRRYIAERAKALLLKSGQFGQSSVNIALWMHYALLEKVNLPSQLKGPVEESAQQATFQVLSRVVELWLEADVVCRAYLPEEKFIEKLSVSVRAEIVDMFREEDAHGQSVFSYAAFCAMELGLKYEPVDMYFYDLVQRTGGAFLFRPIMHRNGLEGVWHTSIVVFGTEIYVLGDLRVSAPQDTEFGLPKKFMRLGCTLKSEQSFFDHVEEELSPMFRSETYDLMENNCNHFCDRASEFLLGKHIPDTVRNQSQLILDRMDNRIFKVGRKILNCWLRRCHQRAVKKANAARSSRSNSLCLDDVQQGLRQRNADGKKSALQQSMMKLYSVASTERTYGAVTSIPYSQFGTMQSIAPAASHRVTAEQSYRPTM